MAENFNDYKIEEADDPRTWTDELVPDCERSDEPTSESANGAPSDDDVFGDLLITEYVGEFRALIDACGQVSYYMNMVKFVQGDVAKAKKVAAAYQHDLRYYKEQYNEWRVKALRSFDALGVHAAPLGHSMPSDKKVFLNNLVLHKDRRECYKYYLDGYFPKGITFSPTELEKKYAERIKKRLKRKK